MSLFGKMNQTEEAKRRRDHPGNNHGGAGGRRAAKLYITSGDFAFLPTHLPSTRYRKWSTPLLQAGYRGFF